MKALPKIPLLSTRELWDLYVRAPIPFEQASGGTQDDFLILRLEEAAAWVRLPAHPHRREVNELLFLTRGELVRGADGNMIRMRAGEAHILLSGQVSTLEYFSEDLAGYYCHFSLETIIQLYHREHMIRELGHLGASMKRQALGLDAGAAAAAQAIFERLLEEHQGSRELRLIDAYLVALCYELRRHLLPRSAEERLPRAQEIAYEFKSLLIKHLPESSSLTFFARLLGISPNHLNKAVRQALGKPASALMAEMRLLEARVLLKHGSLSVSEIAYRLGFLDPSYFSRFFRKHMGLTPSQYRRQA